MNYRDLFLCLALLVSVSSCEIINPSEEIPAYISVKNPVVVLDEGTGFSTNVGLRNIWLYHGGELQGTYQFDPAVDTVGRVFPILNLDKYEFFIDPGIYETGQSAFQIPYPFWDRLTFRWEANPLDTLELTPEFHYIDPALYETPVDEHFEGGNIGMDPFATGLNSTEACSFVIDNNDVFQETGSGKVVFDATHRWFEVISSVPFITTAADNIFAEVTYKSNIPFTIGLIYQTSTTVNGVIVLSVNPSGNWNTVYVHMISEVRDILNTVGANTIFNLWLKADGENKDGYILFDDIRVIKEK